MSDVSRVEEYRLSAQQCAAHLAATEGMSSSLVVLIEGPVGEFEVDALRAALQREAERHEILRTRYRAVADVRYPVQQVLTCLEPAWRLLEEPVDDAHLIDMARGLIDIYAGAVLASALCISEGRIRWALAAAQHSLDFASLQALAIRCLTACQARTSAADEADEPLQYADYAAWQEEVFTSELGQDGAQFWEAKLLATADAPRLPFRRSVPTGGLPAAIEFLLPDADTLSKLAVRCGISVEAVLRAMWLSYIARLSESETVSFTWICGQRSPEVQDAIGKFAVSLPVTVGVGEVAGTVEHIGAIAAHVSEFAEWHEYFDATRHYERLERDGIPSGAVVFEHVKLDALPSGWAWRTVDATPGAAWLTCLCIEQESGFSIKWISGGYFAPDALSVFGRQFTTFVGSAVSEPHLPWRDLSLLGEQERLEVLSMASIGANREEKARSTARLHQLFEQAASRDAGRAAVIGEGGCLTYGELDARANHLAQRLGAVGVKPGAVVGIYIGRSVHAIAAMLAVLKTGSAYVPIDPDYPAERVEYVLRDADISVVITLSADAAVLSEQGRQVVVADAMFEGSAAFPPVNVPLDALAYLIYTSGSTGQPKGVMVSHANAVASTLARTEFYAAPVQSYLLLSSFSFDSSVAGIFWTLAQGGTLHLPLPGEHNDPERLARKIEEQRISHVLTLPSFYQQILQYLGDASSLRCAIVAGEACYTEVVAKHRLSAPGADLVNEYGPTEGTVWSNAFRISKKHAVEDGVPIGRPIPGTRAPILDAELALCPIGQAGELFLGGAGVTRGYLNRPGLTAQRYVADPLNSGERLYRTGDRARYRPDGEIEYLGRIDRQVKLRGHRVELGEIEDCLAQYPVVREAAVLLQEDAALGDRIVAHVSLAHTAATENTANLAERILAFVRDRLPAIMVPAAISVADELPKLPNGKIDRESLATLSSTYHRPPFVAPASGVEQTLAGIWQVVLKVDQVGLDDDFFALGGHSLLATQVVARVRQELSIELPVRDVFTSTRLRDLVARVSEGSDDLTRDLALLENIGADVEAK